MLKSNTYPENYEIAPSGTAFSLARYALELDSESVDARTKETVLRCVFDALTSAAAGILQPGVIATHNIASQLFGSGTFPIWFTGERASGLGALVSNSTAAAALDLDDGYRSARGHPGAAVIPAALAALHLRPETSADEFLAAIVVGYEVGIRLAMARPGYAPSGAWSGFGVVATAGRLLGASASQLANALAIVAQTAPALPALAGIAGSDVKEGIPAGTSTGWVALQLALAGVSGPCSVLDDQDLFNRDRMLLNLGGGAPLINGTYFKPYGCCRHIHAPIEALRFLMSRHSVTWGEIAAVNVHTYNATFNLANKTEPHTLVEAQYSVPYCVALCARYGWEALVPLDSRHFDDVDVMSLAKRVVVVHDPEIEPLFPQRSPARLVIRLRSGARIQSEVMDARGDPSCPLSWDELEQKLMIATRATLTTTQRSDLLRGIDGLRGGTFQSLLTALNTPGVQP